MKDGALRKLNLFWTMPEAGTTSTSSARWVRIVSRHERPGFSFGQASAKPPRAVLELARIYRVRGVHISLLGRPAMQDDTLGTTGMAVGAGSAETDDTDADRLEQGRRRAVYNGDGESSAASTTSWSTSARARSSTPSSSSAAFSASATTIIPCPGKRSPTTPASAAMSSISTRTGCRGRRATRPVIIPTGATRATAAGSTTSTTRSWASESRSGRRVAGRGDRLPATSSRGRGPAACPAGASGYRSHGHP